MAKLSLDDIRKRINDYLTKHNLQDEDIDMVTLNDNHIKVVLARLNEPIFISCFDDDYTEDLIGIGQEKEQGYVFRLMFEPGEIDTPYVAYFINEKEPLLFTANEIQELVAKHKIELVLTEFGEDSLAM